MRVRLMTRGSVDLGDPAAGAPCAELVDWFMHAVHGVPSFSYIRERLHWGMPVSNRDGVYGKVASALDYLL
jgi:hypothetical protein